MNALLRQAKDGLVPDSGARRLLLIESEEDQAIYWSSLLASLGFPVIRAQSLAQAKELMASSPELIVCAAHLSDGRGSDFFSSLRGRAECSRMYLILLTSGFGQEELIESLSFGANDCMDKGASLAEVRARMRLAERVIGLNEAVHDKSTSLAHALELLRSELESAARLQSAMLPRPQEMPGLRMEALYRPSDTLGGDMLGFAPLQEGRRIVFGLIDVVGHGTASALISCSLMRELIDRLAVVADGIQELGNCAPQVIGEMNARYCKLGIPGMYFTALAGVLDLDRGRLHYCQAGHPSIYHFDGSSGWRVVEDSGFPIGLLEEATFSPAVLDFLPGDRLLLVSDGLLRPSDADPIGSRAVLDLLRRLGPDAAAILAQLDELAAQAVGEDRDDQSAMLLVFPPEESS
jgi:sigma-B regulation protein RsbU (phosphoserine phosphatase)